MPQPKALPTVEALYHPLSAGDVRLECLTEAHRSALARTCAADVAIWQIYSSNFGPEHFDANFDALIGADAMAYAVFDADQLVGMTAWLRPDWAAETIEIGNSYLAPSVRGSGVNRAMKRLMIDHAFSVGIRRIEFRIDERNRRSQAATAKLGCTKEGVLRSQKITWTGHVRDVGLWSLLADDDLPWG